MNLLLNIPEPSSKNNIEDSIKNANNTIKFYNSFKESLLVSELPEELRIKLIPKKVIIIKKPCFPFLSKNSTVDDFSKQRNFFTYNGRNSSKKLPEIKVLKNEENVKTKFNKDSQKINKIISPKQILDFSLVHSPSNDDFNINNKHSLLESNRSEKFRNEFINNNLNPQYSQFIKTLPIKSSSKPLYNFIKSLDVNLRTNIKTRLNGERNKFRNKSVNEHARLKFKIEDQFSSLEKEFKKANKNLIKIVNESNIHSKENTFEDNYEKDYLKNETKNLNREVFIYHKNNKEEKRAYFSIVKNNIFERSNHIERISCEGIYKFRDIIYNKFGKGFMQKQL